jgi:hypothetical protein
MWIFLTFLLLLLLTIVWLLWSKLVICINSYQGRYYCTYGGLITVSPVEQDDRIFIWVKVPFYTFRIDPQRSKKKTDKAVPGKPDRKKPTTGKGRKLRMTFYLRILVDALKTFTIRRFQLDLDTGDFVLNAQLTPVVVALNRGGARVQVNYHGHTNLWIVIENQLVRLVPLAFRFVREKYL